MTIIIETSKCITSEIESQKFLFKEKFANSGKFQPLRYSSYMIISSDVCCIRVNNSCYELYLYYTYRLFSVSDICNSCNIYA